MTSFGVLVCLVLMSLLSAHASPRFAAKSSSESYPFYSKTDWQGLPGTDVQPLHLPVPYVVIHHTYIPAACYSVEDCSSKMRGMQNYHNGLGWGDIGYHFCVGSEGGAYEGRGWDTQGFHANVANNYSIGICLIGDWRVVKPTPQQLDTTKALIAEGVRLGKISRNYKLIGHDQVVATECPGGALTAEFSKWDNYVSGKPDFSDIPLRPFPFYNKEEWQGLPGTDVEPLYLPSPYVVIHHTYIPAACYTFEDCSSKMRGMQYYHNSLGWGDIGYHFCVGSEGSVYEGRGWDAEGAHATGANKYSIGICLIGDWRVEAPTPKQLEATKALIAEGVRLGKISRSYKLIGHDQVNPTECPGGALTAEFSKWDNYAPGKPDFSDIQLRPFAFYNKEEWLGLPGTDVEPLHLPSPYVVIHHTYIPAACYTFEDCASKMRGMQYYHNSLGYGDIGYNFCVGSEGSVYEGRGWDAVGAHATGANKYSIGICLIGDWRVEVPTPKQLETTKALIAEGVRLGKISRSYKLIGHDQVNPTECPGGALTAEFSKWDNYAPGKPDFSEIELRPFPFYNKAEWLGLPGTDVEPLHTPVPYVVIHHTYLPAACYTFEDCASKMRGMQYYHNSLDRGDIGYNFCVGSEGGAYEGRGWDTEGAHATVANKYSVGICLIGDWRVETPPQKQLEVVQALIAEGVAKGKITANYRLIGHNQVSPTECPGPALTDVFSKWSNYVPGQQHFPDFKS